MGKLSNGEIQRLSLISIGNDTEGFLARCILKLNTDLNAVLGVE